MRPAVLADWTGPHFSFSCCVSRVNGLHTHWTDWKNDSPIRFFFVFFLYVCFLCFFFYIKSCTHIHTYLIKFLYCTLSHTVANILAPLVLIINSHRLYSISLHFYYKDFIHLLIILNGGKSWTGFLHNLFLQSERNTSLTSRSQCVTNTKRITVLY